MRLWPEELGDGQVEWRGQVRHVISGQWRYFRQWPALVAALQDMLAACQEEPGCVEQSAGHNDILGDQGESPWRKELL